MKALQISALVGILGILAACAQQPEPIRPQPVFDKLGTGSCQDGYVYVPGTAPTEPCVPIDECEGLTGADGATIPCLPPGGRDDDDGRTPTGTPGTPRTG